MIPIWLLFVTFWIGFAIGCIARISYEAEAKKDEKIIDHAPDRAYKAGYQAARDE